MCRSDPHTPLAAMRTIASAGSRISGSGTSCTRTSPGAWKVTARIRGRTLEEHRPRLLAGGAVARRTAALAAGRPYAARMSEPSKAVLITGCSSGIGRSTALRLAAGGWRVYATARRPESIAELGEAGCHTLALDVTDEDSMRVAVETVEQAEGAVGVLVNNAGYSQSGAIETVGMDA